jgi:2'-5' RNA ligase
MKEQGRAGAKSLRLFVAIELPDEVRRYLERTIQTLQTAGADKGLRWVRPEGIHVTLKFLGSTNEDDLAGITSGLWEVAARHAPFDLQSDGLGSFGGRRSLRVIWVGVGGDTEALGSLAADVERAMAKAGFAAEARPYAAHLTLARVREDTSPDAREVLHRIVAEQAVVMGPVFHVNQCSLMESTIQRGGAVYRALATFPLQGQARR